MRTDTDGRPTAVRFPTPRAPHPAGHNRPHTRSVRWDGTARATKAGVEIATPQPEEWKPLEAIIETWRVDDEWWRKPISRLYVEAVLEGGKRLLLYRDLITGQWFAQQP